MKAMTIIFISSLFIFFAIQTAIAGEKPCFNEGDPVQSYYQSQLETAFSIGFNGYEALCEMRCFKSETCQKKCQNKHGISQLGIKYSELDTKLLQPGSCQALSSICSSVCTKYSQSCEKSCGLTAELISGLGPRGGR